MSKQRPDLDPDFFTFDEQGVFELRVAEGLDLDANSGPAFKSTLFEAIADYACRDVIIDVSGAGHVDSAALVHLVEAHSAAREKNIPFVVDIGAHKRLEQLLEMTGLLDVLQVITVYQQS